VSARIDNDAAKAWAIFFARAVLGRIFFMAGCWKVFTLGPAGHVRRYFLPFEDTFLPDGKPVVGAVVEPSGYRFDRGVGYGDIPGLEKLSITDAKGEFALRIPAPAGKLDVRVTSRSLAPHIERMLAPGEPRTIRLSEGATTSPCMT
jgi:hypothetical protein